MFRIERKEYFGRVIIGTLQKNGMIGRMLGYLLWQIKKLLANLHKKRLKTPLLWVSV